MKNADYYVYSTLTSGVDYVLYEDSPGGKSDGAARAVKHKVSIHGGSNVPDGFLRTPIGVVTPITADELELLKKNPTFQKHFDNGFIKYSKVQEDPEIVAADMRTRDKSAPMVPQDYEDRMESTSMNDKDPRFPVGAKLKEAAPLNNQTLPQTAFKQTMNRLKGRINRE